MIIAVTGSHGTIGGPLVAELRGRGHEVWGIELQHKDDPHTMRADIADYRQIRQALNRIDPDIVYHLAAEFGRMNGEDHYEQVWRTNVIGTRNILEVQKGLGFRHIFASSSEVYGEAGVDWISEDLLRLNAQPPLTNDYAISKRVNEMQIDNFAVRHGHDDAAFLQCLRSGREIPRLPLGSVSIRIQAFDGSTHHRIYRLQASVYVCR
jgi:dTDP-glucose 4,6-dehydratase